MHLRWPRDAMPELRVAGRFPHDDRDFRPVYRSANSHALHVYEYPAQMRMAKRALDLKPGTLTLSPAGCETRYHVERPGHHWCVHFLARSGGAAGGAARIPTVLALGPRHHEVVDRLARIIKLRATGGADAIAAASAGLQSLLLNLAVWRAVPPQPGRRGAEAAIDELIFLVQRRLHRQLRVADLARDVGLSPNYLARQFRQRTGMTVRRYILSSRVERAKLLLQTTNLSVKVIGARVGFGDPQHFNKQFRHLTGQSPTAYRELPS